MSSVGDVLPLKFVLPAYTAEIGLVPTGMYIVLSVAVYTPPEAVRALVPIVLAPSTNLTLPVGGAPARRSYRDRRRKRDQSTVDARIGRASHGGSGRGLVDRVRRRRRRARGEVGVARIDRLDLIGADRHAVVMNVALYELPDRATVRCPASWCRS